MDESYKNFEALCKTNNVTVYKVCKETGIATSTTSMWKSGKSTPKVDKLMAIANYFNVSLDYLLTGKDKIENNLIKSRDIQEQFETVCKALKSANSENNPLYCHGKIYNQKSIDLLLKNVELALATIERDMEEDS